VPEAIVAGLFGLLIGSFLNVCVYRLPRDLSVVHPRSFCPVCEKPIAWFDNLPVLTWLLLRGKCRYCRTPIPVRYPAVELLTGLLFFVGVASLGPTFIALRFCIFCALMVGLIFTDLEERILPDEMTLGGAVAGVVLAWFAPLPPSIFSLFLPSDADPRLVSVVESAAAGGLMAVLLWGIGVIYLLVRKKEGLGFGDVKMVVCIGAFLGLPATLLTLVAGSVLGSVTGLAWIWVQRKDAATYELPFGSFLGIAALAVAVLIGPLGSSYGSILEGL
jgi:leader peptidase (prepilin peptidase)/N-methyltransferase